jgi:hypothetical protein
VRSIELTGDQDTRGKLADEQKEVCDVSMLQFLGDVTNSTQHFDTLLISPGGKR